MDKIKTFAAIFSFWDTAADCGRDCNIGTTIVANMKRRNQVDAKYFKRIVAGAKKIGRPEVTTDLLSAIAEEKENSKVKRTAHG